MFYLCFLPQRECKSRNVPGLSHFASPQVDGYLLAAHNSILALDSGNCGDADAVPADWSGLDVAPQQAVVEGGGGAFEYLMKRPP